MRKRPPGKKIASVYEEEQTKTMTRFLFLFSFLFFIVCSAAFAGAGLRGISLIGPTDKSVVDGKLISVVIDLSQNEIDRVVITNNKKEIENTTVAKGRQYFCGSIAIELGLNEIEVRTLAGDRVVDSKEAAVFFRSDLSKKAMNVPAGFSPRPFHREGAEEACRPCHRMEVTQNDVKPEKPEDSMCYKCHSKVMSFKYVHGPAARWTCLVCHDKDSRPSIFATRQPDKDSCFPCHSDAMAAWAGKKFVHGPTATGKCTVCHNPHASDNAFWLRKPTWNLCVSCHEDMAKKAHFLNVFGAVLKPHPTKGVKDPSTPGKKLSCASCHSPHVSNTSTLLISYEGSIYDFCNRCHNN
jgi:predicted CXXCH cytochrome family protein